MITPEEMRNGFIPTHSYLFGAWVDAGILGAVFWAWIFVLAARVLMRVYPETAQLLPVVAFLSFLLLWDILFSPYGTESRYAVPYSIVLITLYGYIAPSGDSSHDEEEYDPRCTRTAETTRVQCASFRQTRGLAKCPTCSS